MRIALFSAAFLAANLATAATPIDGLYGSVFGGYTYLSDNVSKVHHGYRFARASFDGGYNAGFRFGFQSNPLRYEAEYTYLNVSLEKFHNLGSPFLVAPIIRHHRRPFITHRSVHGFSSASFGMANIYYDFPDMVPCISPFVGIGLGYGWIRTSLRARNFIIESRHLDVSGSSFAYQGTGGFTFNFIESWALNIAYRYIGAPRVDHLGKSFQGHLASVGLVYRYDEYLYK